MLRHFPSFSKPTPTDVEIAKLLKKLSEMKTDDADYPKVLSFLERLNKVKADERRPKISRDTMLLVLGNLAGIVLIVAYEQKHVITSKGFSQIIRPKVP